MKSVHRRGTSPLTALITSAAIVVLSSLVPLDTTVTGAQTIAQTSPRNSHASRNLVK
jgi:hypothetical protein